MRWNWIFFLCLLLGLSPKLNAVEKLFDEKDPVLAYAIKCLQNKQYDRVYALAGEMVRSNPLNVEGYCFAVLAQKAGGHNVVVVSIVEDAKKRGIRDPWLLTQQARALYNLGGLFSALGPLTILEQELRTAKAGDRP